MAGTEEFDELLGRMSACDAEQAPALTIAGIGASAGGLFRTVEIEPGRVHVIPPNANLKAIDAHLRLSEFGQRRIERAPLGIKRHTIRRAGGGPQPAPDDRQARPAGAAGRRGACAPPAGPG